MTSNVVSLASKRIRRSPTGCCGCDSADGLLCYPHRLLALRDRVSDVAGLVEAHRYCDLGTFESVAADLFAVIDGITGECLPAERTTR